MNAVRWHWVAEDGSEHELSEEQLIAGLSSEQVPVYALVWREGWGEWVPAMRVVELAWALPAGGADVPHKPKPGDGSRPTPDLSIYPTLRDRARRIRTGELQPNANLPQPRSPAPVSKRLEAPPPSRALGLPKPPVPKSDPASSQSWDDEPPEDATVVERPGRSASRQGKVPSETPPSMLLDNVPRPPVHPQPNWPDIPAGAMRPPAPPRRKWLMTSMLAAGAMLVAAIVVVATQDLTIVTGSPSSYAEQAASAGSAAASAAPQLNETPAMSCQVRRGRQLAEWVIPQVLPALAAMPDGRLAVGYAQTVFYGIGVIVNLNSLDREYAFREYRKQTLYSVVPSYEKGRLLFAAPRQPSTPAAASALPGDWQRIIGRTQSGISLRTGNGAPVPLWPLPRGKTTSVPVLVRLQDESIALALRMDGPAGSIQLGKLDAQGKALGKEMTRVESPAKYVGEPSLAVRGNSTVLAFAGRKADEPNWNIYAALGKDGQLPKAAKAISLGTPNETAAFIVPLGQEHYLLSWSDKSALDSVTKVVVLDNEFRILGNPVEVSSQTQQSASAGLWASGEDAIALYYVSSGANTELWGASLSCTP